MKIEPIWKQVGFFYLILKAYYNFIKLNYMLRLSQHGIAKAHNSTIKVS